MGRISGLLTLSGTLTVGWWVLDRLLPDLLPKVPTEIALPLVIGAAAMVLASLAIIGWRRLLAMLPRPWFPTPFWRIAYWLRHRPTVSIFVVAPRATSGATTMEECTIALTLWRNLSASPAEAVVRFDSSVLVLRKLEERNARGYEFRPKEAGGLLSLPVAGGTVDSVFLEYDATGLPALISEAPDFNAGYSLELSGVKVEMRGAKPITGSLPPATWQAPDRSSI